MKRAGWLAFAALAFALLWLTLDRVADRGRFAAAYSSYGSGPRGTRALYLLVEQLVAPVMRWAQDLARLPSGAVLVALGGCDAPMARPVSRYERQELVRWVRSGGVLVVAGARDYLPQALGVQFQFDPRCKVRWSEFLEPQDLPEPEGEPPSVDAGAPVESTEVTEERVISSAADGGVLVSDPSEPKTPSPVEDETTWAVPMSPVLRGMPVMPFRDPGHLIVTTAREPEILLGDPRVDADGRETELAPLAVVLRHGMGRVIVLASASMLQNPELGTSDGGELFVRLLRHYAPGAPVLFDEYHLGIGERRSLMRYLRQMGAAPLAIQLALLIGLALWRAGARFGGIQAPPPPPPPASASFVHALGQLYARSADAHGAIELIARDAYARIAAHHHLDVAPPAKLAQALSERGANGASQAVQEIERAAGSSKRGTVRLEEIVGQIDVALARALARDPI